MTSSLLRCLALAGLLGLSVALAGPLASGAALAAEPPEKATAQVKSGLYVTAREAWDLIQADPDNTLLIDTRDPVEVMFTGFATETDIHVPYRIADRTTFNETKGRWRMAVNAGFANEVEARLEDLGADRETTRLIFMCRSGSTRSAPGADLLFDRGWKQTYTMIDGFEGATRKDGDSAGVRDVNGWRNSGLPWSYSLPADVIYRLPE